MNFESFLNNPYLIKMYENYNQVWKKHEDYPYLNHFGLNFDQQGIVSIKFYFHLFHKVTIEEAQLFLPQTDDFFKFYDLHEISKNWSMENSGCAFELKFKNQFEPTYGFHLKLNGGENTYDILGYPEKLPLNYLDINKKPGVNYEYTLNNKLIKKYYYFDDSVSKNYLSKRFNVNFFKDFSFLEYTESDLFSKINAWNSLPFQNKINDLNLFTVDNLKLINNLINKYNLDVKSVGKYENNSQAAIYFSSKQFEPVNNGQYNDTLKLLLDKNRFSGFFKYIKKL